VLSDGLILKSQATLFRARRADCTKEDRAVMAELLARLKVD